MNYDERQVRRLEAQAVDRISEMVEVQKFGEKLGGVQTCP